MRFAVLSLSLSVTLAALPAHAQAPAPAPAPAEPPAQAEPPTQAEPSAQAEPPAQPTPAPGPQSQPAPTPQAPTPQAPATGDTDEVTQLYQKALDAFARGQYAEAATMFRQVSERSQDPARKGAAAELAKQADMLAAGGKTSGGPGASPDAGTPDAGQPGGGQLPIVTGGNSRSSRLRLLTGSLLLGLNYGWMVPMALDIDSSRNIVGTYLFTAGASFAIPYVLTRRTRVTRAMASLTMGGGALGAAHGAFLYILASPSDSNESRLIGTMLLFSVAEAVGGYMAAKHLDMTGGEAQSINFGGAAGALAGLGLYTVLRGDFEGDRYREYFASLLAGSLLGMGGGYAAAKKRDYSTGDAYIVQMAGLIGAYTAYTPLAWANAENPRVLVGTMLAGAGLGLFAGDYIVRKIDASSNQGMFVSLGAVAGGLVGTGLAYLALPEDGGADDRTADYLFPAGALGAIGGFLFSYSMLDLTKTAASKGGPQVTGLNPWSSMSGDDARGMGLVGRF